MSQESPLARFSQEAISRMSPYELAERAVSLRTELSHNTLHLEPVELEDGGTLFTIASGLVAHQSLRVRTTVEENELVRRQFLTKPLTVFADVVELRPPTGSDQGDARLYNIKEPLTPSLAEARTPFYAAAVEAATDPQWGNPPILFDGVNISYSKAPGMGEPDQTYLSSGYDKGHLPLLAGEQTTIHTEQVGINELDKEIGVLATVSGVAHVALNKYQFVRIASTGVFHGPAMEQAVSIDLPEGTPQYNSSKFHRIPEGATVSPNEKGELVPHSDRTNADKYKHTKLNPSLNPAKALELMPDEAVDWADCTVAFLASMETRLARLLPLDIQASYEQTLRLAQNQIREALAARREPHIGKAGCLAVAAHLSQLPTELRQAHRVDKAFFSEAV